MNESRRFKLTFQQPNLLWHLGVFGDTNEASIMKINQEQRSCFLNSILASVRGSNSLPFFFFHSTKTPMRPKILWLKLNLELSKLHSDKFQLHSTSCHSRKKDSIFVG